MPPSRWSSGTTDPSAPARGIYQMPQDKLPVEPPHHDAQSMGEDLVESVFERVQQMLKAGTPRHGILPHLTAAAEALAGSGAVSSILVIDENGLLRNGASPNLPADYLNAIDRLKPDANI